MSATTPPPATPTGARSDRPVPPHARQLAAQLSTLFEHDQAIVQRLNDAHRRLHDANERLCSELAPDVFGLIYDGTAATAIHTSPIVTPIRNGGGPDANTQMLEALQQIHGQIHRAFCSYQHASEQRRQLTVDVGELSQQLTQALCAAGWSADRARHANVHQLARPELRPPLTKTVATTPLSGQPEPLHAATLSPSSRRPRTSALPH